MIKAPLVGVYFGENMAIFNKPNFNTVWASAGVKIKPADDKMPVPIPCYLDHFIVSYGAECSSAGQGCIPNPCPK